MNRPTIDTSDVAVTPIVFVEDFTTETALRASTGMLLLTWTLLETAAVQVTRMTLSRTSRIVTVDVQVTSRFSAEVFTLDVVTAETQVTAMMRARVLAA